MPQRDLGQRRSDGLITAGGGVLIAHGGRRCRMSEAGHQFRDRGTREGSQHGSRMAQVVEAKVGTVGRVLRSSVAGWATISSASKSKTRSPC
jgi:hypothetical protein